MSINMTKIAWPLLLSACTIQGAMPTYLRDRSGDYASEQTIEPLIVPNTVDAVALDSTLMIPEINRSKIK